MCVNVAFFSHFLSGNDVKLGGVDATSDERRFGSWDFTHKRRSRQSPVASSDVGSIHNRSVISENSL